MSVWSYIIVFNDKVSPRAGVQEFLDEIPEVTYWYACLPNCIFAASSLTAGGLAEKIKKKFGTSAGQRFLVSEIADDKQGWLPKQAWQLLNHPANPTLPKT
ncbi:hypothetical protein [Sphingobium sp. Z007]|uniref:hypothetical protein n=1 Tax=Sphingobium sp. Z007 TaxID=627495 RepID=UPI001124E6EC|nr:hypothetical protein [Sphingobium sp. Z007]